MTSSPAGINCGGDCLESYDEGTVVQLTANPTSGSEFAGWTGSSDCSDGVVTMDADGDCTATFNLLPPIQHLLTVSKSGGGGGTVTSSPAGIDCGGDCDELYPGGTQVSLTAVPDAGSTFSGWSGDGDCSDGEVTMQQDVSCVAHFGLEIGSCSGSEVVTIDDWSTSPATLYAAGTVELGELVYTDRQYELLGYDAEVEGATLIQTANNDKDVSEPLHLHLTLCSPAAVYVGYDKRAGSLPTWLDDPTWSHTGATLVTGDTNASPMDVYRATLPGGQLILGGNQQGGPTGALSNYLVIVRPVQSVFADGLETGDTSAWTLVCDESNAGDPRCAVQE